jgi:poly(3-hydroxybutyrate) depolymerase
MVEHAIATFAADRRKVFVTGLSAGGAMASAMLAAYPEVFAGGAIIAGLPYGCASNVQQAFEAMFTAKMAFPVHPHMLRHGCGYALANAGHDTRALQAWLSATPAARNGAFALLPPSSLPGPKRR